MSDNEAYYLEGETGTARVIEGSSFQQLIESFGNWRRVSKAEYAARIMAVHPTANELKELATRADLTPEQAAALVAANARLQDELDTLRKRYDLALRAVSTLYEHAEIAARLLDRIGQSVTAGILRAVMRDAKRFAPEGEYEDTEPAS